MATEILAVGNTEANSSEITLAEGASMIAFIKGASGGEARVGIYLKDDGGAFEKIAELNSNYRPALLVNGPGVYRLTRVSGSACGVSRA